MAENGVRIGLRNLHYKLLTVEDGTVTYGAPTKISGLISGALTPQTTEGELYADDTLSEFHSSISAFDVTIGVKDIPLEDRAKLLGYPISEDGRMRVTSNANAPLVAISFIRFVSHRLRSRMKLKVVRLFTKLFQSLVKLYRLMDTMLSMTQLLKMQRMRWLGKRGITLQHSLI